VVELASLLELIASGAGGGGGGDEAEVDEGVVEAGIRADEARNEWGIDDKTPLALAEGKWAPKGLGGGGGCCPPERAAAVAACR